MIATYDPKYSDLLRKLPIYLNSKVIGIDFKVKDKSIEFSTIDNRYFFSKISNRLPMKDGDPRILKLGRSYLETNELTLEQFKYVNKFFKDLHSLKVIKEIITEDGVVIADSQKWYGFKRKVKQEPVKGDYNG